MDNSNKQVKASFSMDIYIRQDLKMRGHQISFIFTTLEYTNDSSYEKVF